MTLSRPAGFLSESSRWQVRVFMLTAGVTVINQGLCEGCHGLGGKGYQTASLMGFLTNACGGDVEMTPRV